MTQPSTDFQPECVACQFDRGFVLMCQELRPNSGDEIGPGVYVA